MGLQMADRPSSAVRFAHDGPFQAVDPLASIVAFGVKVASITP